MNPSPTAPVLCIGGCHIDVKARLEGPVRMATSNPVRTSRTPGGVACNVARWLARLGTGVRLASIVGDDAAGMGLITMLEAEGVDASAVDVVAGGITASYTAIIAPDGDLVIGTADMGIYERLDREWAERVVTAAPALVIVIDANPTPEALGAIVDGKDAALLAADPVSVDKSLRLADHLSGIDIAFPDAAELAALSGSDDVVEGAELLRARGVGTVVVTLGPAGALVAEGPPPRVHPPVAPQRIVDVTGAGDAFLAGYVHALVTAEADPAAWGLATASLAVGSDESVPVAASLERVRARL